MSNQTFSSNELVVFQSGIYQIKEVITNQDTLSTYKLILIAYIKDSTGSIDSQLAIETTAQENSLTKFSYGLPAYKLGSRLADGSEVYLVIFNQDTHQYYYNLKQQNTILANLPESDLSWRN